MTQTKELFEWIEAYMKDPYLGTDFPSLDFYVNGEIVSNNSIKIHYHPDLGAIEISIDTN